MQYIWTQGLGGRIVMGAGLRVATLPARPDLLCTEKRCCSTYFLPHAPHDERRRWWVRQRDRRACTHHTRQESGADAARVSLSCFEQPDGYLYRMIEEYWKYSTDAARTHDCNDALRSRAPWYTIEGRPLEAYVIGIAGGSASGKVGGLATCMIGVQGIA